jgi:hypothetical protein
MTGLGLFVAIMALAAGFCLALGMAPGHPMSMGLALAVILALTVAGVLAGLVTALFGWLLRRPSPIAPVASIVGGGALGLQAIVATVAWVLRSARYAPFAVLGAVLGGYFVAVGVAAGAEAARAARDAARGPSR